MNQVYWLWLRTGRKYGERCAALLRTKSLYYIRAAEQLVGPVNMSICVPGKRSFAHIDLTL